MLATDYGQRGLEPREVLGCAFTVVVVVDARDESVDLSGFVSGVDKGLPGKVEVRVMTHVAPADSKDAKALRKVTVNVEPAQGRQQLSPRQVAGRARR